MLGGLGFAASKALVLVRLDQRLAEVRAVAQCSINDKEAMAVRWIEGYAALQSCGFVFS